MRKITEDAVAALLDGRDFNRDNTRVVHEPDSGRTYMFLHGNLIAVRGNGEITISDGGYFEGLTRTTVERLNGIPGVSINRENWVWYLNGEEWDGDWTTV